MSETDNSSEYLDLIKRAQNGDNAAFDQLYSQLFTPVFRYIYIRVGQKQLAEDLSQEVFIKAFTAIGSFRNRNKHPLAFFFTVARNQIIDLHRKKKIELSEYSDEQMATVADPNNPQQKVIRDQQNSELFASIDQLPAEQAEALRLKYFGGLENKRIAELLGKNEDAIRQLQSRAIRKLRQKFKDNLENI